MSIRRATRIDTTFHETFALNLPSVASVLRICAEHVGSVTADLIRTKADTPLGPNYVKAMPRYARGCGLLKMGSYELTSFGQAAMANDPSLMGRNTQWLMHYHLSAPHGPGPTFWNHLISSTVRTGQTLGRRDVSDALKAFILESQGTTLSTKSIESTVTAFIGSYLKSDALGRLGIFEACGENKMTYTIKQPDAPSQWVLAHALLDYWNHHSPDAAEILLKELGKVNGFAGLFFIGPGLLATLLAELQSANVLRIKRDAPPFVVVRSWHDPIEFWDRIYA